MQRLPERPNLGHLKKQAKNLIALYRSGEPAAVARLRDRLPVAAGGDDEAIRALGLRLHDAQSCVAREYGFASWAELDAFVAARNARAVDRVEEVRNWLRLIYPGDISGEMNPARPLAAARMLEADPGLADGDPYLACAIGNEAALRAATARDPAWIDRPGGPLALPPLIAVTHSSLLRLPEYRERLTDCARFLLEAGADPNQPVASRWFPASLSEPSESCPLSALYGAAGQNHDPELTRLLLAAGANPNDGESLYHSLENPACTRALLEAGARVTGSNALYRVLDLDSIEALRLLLAHGGDPNEPAGGPPISDWGTPLLWAIRRRRSPAHIAALLEAGADAAARTPDGASAHTLALRFGLPEVARLLQGDGSPLPEDEAFIAACAQGDAAAVRRIRARRPDLPGALSQTQLRLLPELAAQGCDDAVRLMVELGWPIAVTGGDWQASALNHAVLRGDAALTGFLLAHGASWQERHGYGDNVRGTLSFASRTEAVAGGDWLGCAQALVAHGMPKGEVEDGWFSDEVTEFLRG
jgi:ankyrin repeat protein